MAASEAPDFSGLSDLWTDVRGTAEEASLLTELRGELSEGHLLWGCDVEVVAARKLRKEVLLWLPQRQAWAWTHLTWHRETDPRWPRTEVFSNWSDLLAELVDADRA